MQNTIKQYHRRKDVERNKKGTGIDPNNLHDGQIAVDNINGLIAIKRKKEVLYLKFNTVDALFNLQDAYDSGNIIVIKDSVPLVVKNNDNTYLEYKGDRFLFTDIVDETTIQNYFGKNGIIFKTNGITDFFLTNNSVGGSNIIKLAFREWLNIKNIVHKIVVLNKTIWDENNNYILTLESDWNSSLNLNIGLPVPTTRENKNNLSNADIIITNVIDNVVTINSLNKPTEDIIIEISY